MSSPASAEELPRTFMSASAFRALYETADSSQPIILELRLLPDGKLRVFTVLAGQPVYASSIQAFMLDRPECTALRLMHAVEVLWNGQRHTADLEEAYIRAPEVSPTVAVALRLTLNGEVVATDPCFTLSEAIVELREIGAAGGGYWLMICRSCALSRPALPGPGWDDRDEHQCFRDAPDAYASIGGDGPPIRGWGRFSGDYFVSAFHTCSVWKQA